MEQALHGSVVVVSAPEARSERIGRDRLVGFGDIKQASWSSFDLRTYSRPTERVIAAVKEILFQSASEKGFPSRMS
jgi:hypothetical protein